MPKSYRPIYGTPMITECKKSLAFFILAFTFKDDKMIYMDKCLGYFSILRIDIDIAMELNLIHFPKRKPKNNEIIDETSYVSSQKVELYEIIGRIDSEMMKFRNSLTKGKTTSDID